MGETKEYFDFVDEFTNTMDRIGKTFTDTERKISERKTNVYSIDSIDGIEIDDKIEPIDENELPNLNKTITELGDTAKIALLLGHANQNAKRVNKTVDPLEFFVYFDLIIENLNEVIKYEGKNPYMKGSPKAELDRILKNKDLTIKDFIERFYKSVEHDLRSCVSQEEAESVKNRYYSIKHYLDKMSIENVELTMDCWKKVKNYILS